MTTATPAAAGYPRETTHGQAHSRSAAGTKPSYKTTEFWVYLASVVGVLIASQAVGATNTHSDYFRADRAWLYITLLSIGYLISRGLAKSGTQSRQEAE